MEPYQEFELLLNEFTGLPKVIRQPTYLELCQYPYRRFEEICSRLLSFFLLPTNNHGLEDLLLNVLISKINKGSDFIYTWNKLEVKVEDYAEGKRIDIVIIGDNFVIGVENKIYADLYNPLEIYRRKLAESDKIYTIGIVLSLRKVYKKEEVNSLIQNGFINITYADLFKTLRQDIGAYLEKGNDRYISILTDFITTLENMEENNILNKPLNDFFSEHFEKVDELVNLYNEYNKGITAKQNQHISSLRESIAERTGDSTWGIWDGFDLIWKYKIKDHEIGIESMYEKTKGNPLGKFNILVTTWNVKDWNFYKEHVLAVMPDCSYKIQGNRGLLQYATLIKSDEGTIISSLKEVYDKIQQVIKAIQVQQQTLYPTS